MKIITATVVDATHLELEKPLPVQPGKAIPIGILEEEDIEARVDAKIEERLHAVEELRRMALPVGTPTEMKQESLPGEKELLP